MSTRCHEDTKEERKPQLYARRSAWTLTKDVDDSLVDSCVEREQVFDSHPERSESNLIFHIVPKELRGAHCRHR